MKRLFIRFFLVFMGTAVALGAVEVLVRIFGNKLNSPTVIPLTLKTHRLTTNRVMGYELVPEACPSRTMPGTGSIRTAFGIETTPG